jgi:uncharacterized damage-inducible protein DinB
MSEAAVDNDRALRDHLVRLLGWRDAHAGFDAAVEGVPAGIQGVRPAGLPHSAWELLEHLRLTQADILEFCRGAGYREKEWPADYWPESPAPPDSGAWDRSADECRADREALQSLAQDPDVDLFTTIPWGSGQTYLRELLLVADHTAYHVGQLVLVRRALGAWE